MVEFVIHPGFVKTGTTFFQENIIPNIKNTKRFNKKLISACMHELRTNTAGDNFVLVINDFLFWIEDILSSVASTKKFHKIIPIKRKTAKLSMPVGIK